MLLKYGDLDVMNVSIQRQMNVGWKACNASVLYDLNRFPLHRDGQACIRVLV